VHHSLVLYHRKCINNLSSDAYSLLIIGIELEFIKGRDTED